MKRELWLLYHLLQSTAKDFHQKYLSHQPWILAAVLLWTALHDRPTRGKDTTTKVGISCGTGICWRAFGQELYA